MFDHIKPIDPKAERRKRLLLIGISLATALGIYLYYEYRNYPEERAVGQFLEALERKDYQEAYRLWQPSEYYKMKDFLQDWGPNGMQGSIRDFDITDSQTVGSGVVVEIEINGQKNIALWVERSDKSLSFPP